MCELSLVAVSGLLTVVASLVEKHGLWRSGSVVAPTGLAAARHVESSWTSDRNHESYSLPLDLQGSLPFLFFR